MKKTRGRRERWKAAAHWGVIVLILHEVRLGQCECSSFTCAAGCDTYLACCCSTTFPLYSQAVVLHMTEAVVVSGPCVLFTFSLTCSYMAIGLLLKVMALQKLACLLTVLWDRSITICEPFVLGWKSRGMEDRPPQGCTGRQRLGLWWHRWDAAGPFKVSVREKEEMYH